MIELETLIGFDQFISRILAENDIESLLNIEYMDMYNDEFIQAYMDTLSSGERLAKLYYVYMVLYQLTDKPNYVHNKLVKCVPYAKALYTLKNNCASHENFIEHALGTYFSTIKLPLASIDSFVTKLSIPGEFLYKWPIKYIKNTKVISSDYDKLLVEVNNTKYAFIRCSKKNFALLDKECIYCVNSISFAKEAIDKGYNIRLFLPMPLYNAPKILQYGNETISIIAKISRNSELLNNTVDSLYIPSKFSYDLTTKYDSIYYHLMKYVNYGLEDILSTMSYTNSLYIMDTAFKDSWYFNDLNLYRDWLRINCFINPDNIKYDARRINADKLNKLREIPNGYFDKYILIDSYYAEDIRSMLTEIESGGVN